MLCEVYIQCKTELHLHFNALKKGCNLNVTGYTAILYILKKTFMKKDKKIVCFTVNVWVCSCGLHKDN